VGVSKLSANVKQLTIEMVRLYEPLSKHYIMMLYANTAIAALSLLENAKFDIGDIRQKVRQIVELKRKLQFRNGLQPQLENELENLRTMIEAILEKYN
jgi:hypothetical protein